jgi:hypothetical protein
MNGTSSVSCPLTASVIIGVESSGFTAGWSVGRSVSQSVSLSVSCERDYG